MPRLARLLGSAVLVVSVSFGSSLALGWGFQGHRRLAANVHAPLPAGSCLRAWVEANQGPSFQALAVAPDEWKDRDPLEGDRHFLSIDYSDPPSAYPREWAAVQARFPQYASSNGQVPWRTEELYQRLVADFRAGDSANAVKSLAYLTHYVTDAFSILHDTKNFDGPPGQRGLHARYETRMLDTRARMDDLATRSRSYFGTLGRAKAVDHIFDAILVGNAFVPALEAADLEVAGDVEKLYERTAEMTARRWGDSLTLLASLLSTAWVEAGSPRLARMPEGCSGDVATGEMRLIGYPLDGSPPPPAAPATESSQPGDGQSPAPEAGTPRPSEPGSRAPRDEPSSPTSCSTADGYAGVFILLVLLGLKVNRRLR